MMIVQIIVKDGDLKKFEVKDSGAREEFVTGARRDIQRDKGRFDLIPYYGLERLAQHFENGAKKYGPNNWQKGIPVRTYWNSAARHIGKAIDLQEDEDHQAAAVWNLMCAMWTIKMVEEGRLPKSLDDRVLEDKG